MTLLNDYITLFRGRGDCYGDWNGGCIREPLTPEVFQGHLDGTRPIGVYPSVRYGEGVTACVWGCTDIDKTDDPSDAVSLQSALAAVNVTSWIERSAHGFHVWVFAAELVPSRVMRRALLAAHQVAEVPAKEVNPKQETLKAGEVGNYVRLPYPGGWTEETGRYIQVDWNPWPIETFVPHALAARTPPGLLEGIADLWKPPPEPARIVEAPSLDMQAAARRLTPLGRVIFHQGPKEGQDRSTTLLRLVHEAHDAGIPPADCLMLLEDADLRWGKFMARGPKGEQEIQKMVDRVYGGTD